MASLRREFGKRLRSIRQARQLTQEEFAELVGISVDFLSLIERGISSPSFEVLEQMAAGLWLPVRDLFDFQEGAGQPGQALIRKLEIKLIIVAYCGAKIVQTPWPLRSGQPFTLSHGVFNGSY